MVGDLKKINFLKKMPDEVLEKIAAVTRKERFDAESVLVRQDQAQHLIYMLDSGRVYLNCRGTSGQSLTLDEILPGQTFGLSSLLGTSAATYSAICVTDSTVFAIDSKALLKLFETDYVAGYQVMQQVVLSFKKRMHRHTQVFIKTLSSHPDISDLQDA